MRCKDGGSHGLRGMIECWQPIQGKTSDYAPHVISNCVFKAADVDNMGQQYRHGGASGEKTHDIR